MKSIQKKFFNWTPQDVAEWEKIRSRGLLRFVLRYGMMLVGGVLFVLIGGVVAIQVWNQAQARILIPLLVVIALICLLGGLINSLVTWAMEEKLYKKFKKIHSQESNQSD